MSITGHPIAGPASNPHGRLSRPTAIGLLAALLLVSSWSPALGQAEPEPELTWAPLVTLPPIAAPTIRTPEDLADGFALGDPDAPVTLELWEDFQCPFCQRFTFQVKPALVEGYVETGQARIVFRNLAFIGDESQWAAVAASLAADQDRFWPFHDYLFANLHGENVGSYDLDRLLAIAEAAGLDMSRFKQGLTLDAARKRWAEIEAEARAEASALGINATPTVAVDGVPLRSPDFETVSSAIDLALAASAPEETDAEATETDDGAADTDAGAASTEDGTAGTEE